MARAEDATAGVRVKVSFGISVSPGAPLLRREDMARFMNDARPS